MNSPVKMWRRQKEIRKYIGLKGVVLLQTTIYVAPSRYREYVPYTVVLVELDNGEKIYGQICDNKDPIIKNGSIVCTVLRKIPDINKEDLVSYTIKFKPC
ncbi:MAG: OB-fold domain-containing protein [Candidatus Roizmanbacteria bacterium]